MKKMIVKPMKRNDKKWKKNQTYQKLINLVILNNYYFLVNSKLEKFDEYWWVSN